MGFLSSGGQSWFFSSTSSSALGTQRQRFFLLIVMVNKATEKRLAAESRAHLRCRIIAKPQTTEEPKL